MFTDVPQLPLPRQLVSIDGPRSDVTDTTIFAYGDFGDPVTVTNALGHVTSISERDANGLPLTVVDENGIETALSYDSRSRLIESRVKGGAGDAITTYSYDGASLLTEVTLPDGSNLFYEYDAAHRLTAIANRLGERIEYALDAMGNRTAEVLRSDSGTIVRSQSQICDELGRLLQSIGAGSQSHRLRLRQQWQPELRHRAAERGGHGCVLGMPSVQPAWPLGFCESMGCCAKDCLPSPSAKRHLSFQTPRRHA